MGMGKATITIKDNPNNTVDIGVAFDPPLNKNPEPDEEGEPCSNAQYIAMTSFRLIAGIAHGKLDRKAINDLMDMMKSPSKQ